MTIHPLAGKPVTPEMLVDVPRLVTAYYTDAPDPAVPAQRVAFGTSGHRGTAFTPPIEEDVERREIVLNARRHRSGGHQPSDPRLESLAVVLNARRHRSGGHRAGIEGVRQRGPVLNARRHRSGGHRPPCQSISMIGCRAQRPKASERRSPSHARRCTKEREVLNARRHRSGGHPPAWPRRSTRPGCSTPEGIGAAVTSERSWCRSTSGRAQRPKASERRSPALLLQALWPLRVLNARRHRSGGHTGYPYLEIHFGLCSTPEGIGAAVTRHAEYEQCGWLAGGAQRPKASERRSPASS